MAKKILHISAFIIDHGMWGNRAKTCLTHIKFFVSSFGGPSPRNLESEVRFQLCDFATSL